MQLFLKILSGMANSLGLHCLGMSFCHTFWCSKILGHLPYLEPCPAEPEHILSLEIVWIQISWLLKKPTDLNLHCLPFSI